MLVITLYLVTALFGIYNHTPKNNYQFWKSVFKLPLIVTGLCFIYYYSKSSVDIGITSGYYIGEKFALCFMGFIFSTVILYFNLKSKIRNNGKVRFPYYILVLIAITLLMDYIQFKQQNEIVKQTNVEKKEVDRLSDKELSLQVIKSSIKEFNNQIPFKTADGTILFKLLFDEGGKTVSYYFKDDSADIDNLSIADVKLFKENWKRQLIEIAKTSKNNKHYLNAEVLTEYFLFDKNDNQILELTITPNDYK